MKKPWSCYLTVDMKDHYAYTAAWNNVPYVPQFPYEPEHNSFLMAA